MDRSTYAVTRDDLARTEADVVCGAVLDVLRPVLRVASIDAYSDFRDDLPPAVAAAQEWLRERGQQQEGRDPALGVQVAADDEEGWSVVRTYAAWSIDAEFFDEAGELLAWLHDCGASITADLTEDEAHDLAARLASVTTIGPLPEKRGRRGWTGLFRRR